MITVSFWNNTTFYSDGSVYFFEAQEKCLKTSSKRDGLFFTAMRVVELLLAVLRAFIVPKILGATYYGIAHIFAMIGFFSPLLECGTLSGLQKKISKTLVADPKETHQWQQVAFNFHAGVCIGVAFLLFLFFLFLPDSLFHHFDQSASIPTSELKYILFWGGLTYSLLLLLQPFDLYASLFCIASSQFRILGLQILLRNLVNTVIVLSFVSILNVYSIWLGLILSGFALFLYLKKTFEFPTFQTNLFFQSDSRNRLKELMREGIPIVFLTLFTQIILITDRVMLLWFHADMQEFGYYVLGLSLVHYLFMVPNAMSQFFFSRIYQETSQELHQHKLSDYFLNPVLGLLGFTSFIVSWAYLILPELISCLLPKWVEGIGAARMMLWIACFYGPIQLAIPLFSGRGKIKMVFWHQIPILFFAVASNYFALKWGYGIVGVGFTTVLTNFLYCYALITSGFYICSGHFSGYFIFFAKSLLLFFYFCGCSLWLNFYWSTPPLGDWNRGLLQMGQKTIFFFLTTFPIYGYIFWKMRKKLFF